LKSLLSETENWLWDGDHKLKFELKIQVKRFFDFELRLRLKDFFGSKLYKIYRYAINLEKILPLAVTLNIRHA
jgi:hypothetical protein